MKKLDCRGFACPRPVIMTKKEIDNMVSGEIEVLVDNQGAKENVSKLAQSYGLEYSIKEDSEGIHVIIKKTQIKENSLDKDDKNIVIAITTDCFGHGDDVLGRTLMKSYIYSLTEVDKKPKTLIFINAGVKLTTEGSEVLESLKVLEEQGVEILSCGTCLNFYNLSDKLKIGTVSNMYTIVEKMHEAANTIKI
ncbi:sulfurtransferase-like selenium metabolism protein YedF [Caloramator sp. mosi_1]|uniref:sulfurtransferase-like selenium metabolism protein YedF n=1 Tax=Caloramator sp. mosi_1 TaxID=3023090 RepID=UPI0023610407|nr:sulfurtransferase-like selenium metabolism protein YedF [Caloramator sp. mosi_1]WDC85359.1 sulfurtransferase-like selenium metabolism protein YedF [Caloramator sp. mosi_1]